MGVDYYDENGIVFSLDEITRHFFPTDADKKRLFEHVSQFLEENAAELEEDVVAATTTFLKAGNNNAQFEESLTAFCEVISCLNEPEPVASLFSAYFDRYYPELPQLQEIDFIGDEYNVNAHEAGVPIDEYFFRFCLEGLFETRYTEAGQKAAKAFEEVGLGMEKAEWVRKSF